MRFPYGAHFEVIVSDENHIGSKNPQDSVQVLITEHVSYVYLFGEFHKPTAKPSYTCLMDIVTSIIQGFV